MELKDKLKTKRLERKRSQQALADAIYVSRSAVAKWENGLGLPGRESLEALEAFFQVEPGYFSTESPEDVIVKKNRQLRTEKLVPVLLALIYLLFFFPYTKIGMKLTVLLWQKPLTAYAQGKLSEGTEGPLPLWGYDVFCYPDTDAVFFDYSLGGYVGFFYSESGVPVGFGGTEARFFRYGRNQWLWHEEAGDNWMEAEHITGNWYWYDMNF